MITVPVLKELEFSLFPSTLKNYKGKIDSTLQFLHQNHRAQSFPSIVLRGLVLA